MNIETFLEPYIGTENIEELKREGIDLSQPYHEEMGGVLGVMNDLFEWGDTEKGGDYWCEVAHYEYMEDGDLVDLREKYEVDELPDVFQAFVEAKAVHDFHYDKVKNKYPINTPEYVTYRDKIASLEELKHE